LNNSGHVVGFADLSTGERRAFLWTANDGMTLGTLGGTHSVANDVNDAGIAVGNSTLTDGTTPRAFVWTEEGGMSDLYPDWPSRDYVGNGINSAGDIVGLGEQADGTKVPVIWPSDGGAPIFADVAYGWAEDINNRGMIVGRYRETSYSDPTRPFVWDGGDSLIELPIVDAGGQTVAEGVNDTGWIAGWGSDNGHEVPLLWTPEPATLGLLALGGMALLRRRQCGMRK
jgi:probable HAF family extracellular repeat protein